MLSRRMHSVAKRPALFQINAFAHFLTGALAFRPARPPSLALPARFACYAALPVMPPCRYASSIT